MADPRANLVGQWLAKAANDLRTARLVRAAGGPLDTAIYHCQQSAEKAVKAYLVARGLTPEKTHDVRKLVVEASALEPRFNDCLEPAAALTPYAWEYRYPGDLVETDPTPEEFDEAVQQAQTILDFVSNVIQPAVRPHSQAS